MKFTQQIRLYFELKDFLMHTPFQLKYTESDNEDLAHVYHTENDCYTLDDKYSQLRFLVCEKHISKHNKHRNTEYILNIKHNDGALSDVQQHFTNKGLLAKAVFKLCAIQDYQRS